MESAEAELVGGPLDGMRYCVPYDEDLDGGPRPVIWADAHRRPLFDFSGLDVGMLPVAITQLQYLRQQQPGADGVWRYRFVPPPS